VSIQKIIGEAYLPYTAEFQAKLLKLMQTHRDWLELEVELTQYHANAVHKLREITGIKPDIIGFHSQSIFHAPEKGICWQIGNPHLLAALTGIEVVADFRRRDVAYGGQGAPLVPIFHQALMTEQELPVAIVNIGGVANVTYIGNNGLLIGCDAGPGNALINDAMMKYYGKPYDEDGLVAKSGKINEDLVKSILQDPFFSKKVPKSLDRNHFSNLLPKFVGIIPQDIITTLTALTVRGIYKALSSEILGAEESPQEIYICGGGAKNQTMLEWMPDMKILPNSDYIEAQAFAYLAVRCIKNLPSTFPSTTGVSQATVSGVRFVP